MAMTRANLVERLALCADISKRDADAVVRTVFEAMSQALARGDRIEMRDFGVFSVRQREPREGRNPQTGEAVPVAAKKALHFRAGRRLVQLVNGDPEALAAFREQQHEQRRRRDRQRAQLSLF